MSETVYISLGSNMGSRKTYLDLAKKRLTDIPKLELTAESSLYITKPVGCTSGSPDFLNKVLKFDCGLNPRELLDNTERIEKEMGRKTKGNNEARTIDIDIILFGDRIHEDKRLKIPHPRMSERAFVLAPLCEIAPDLVNPLTNSPCSESLDNIGDQGVTLIKDESGE